MTSKKHAARTVNAQRRREAGLMAANFPHVASIDINMMYSQKGVQQSLPRTVHFLPTSYSYFVVDCLSKECIEGGFDFTPVITTMIRNRKNASQGALSCEGSSSDDHSAVVYEVAIQYS